MTEQNIYSNNILYGLAKLQENVDHVHDKYGIPNHKYAIMHIYD